MGAAVAPMAGADGAIAPPARSSLLPDSIPLVDLPRHYDVERDFHNMENGYWSVMPRVVAEDFSRNNAFVNRNNAVWARNVLPGDNTWTAGYRAAQAAIARLVGVAPDEIAIARSGSDALQMLILNYRNLKPGDAVIHCDLDYDSTIEAMEWLGTHRGVKVVRFVIPEPATTANILAAYDEVLKATPSAKLMLVTMVSHRTGLVTPAKEIIAMARARGVDTIADIAHGVACLDFQLDDLGCDFAGWSVHKWTSAPLGTGALYIRKSRLADIDMAFNDRGAADSVNSRIPPGTVNFAAVLTIPAAVDFHFAVGAAAKERHLRALRDRWVNDVRELPNVEICVPDDPARYCAITSFRLKGMHTDADAQAVQRRLFERHKVHTIWRAGVGKGAVIRATPGLYTTNVAPDALAAALRAEQAMLA
jgi:selenocysteine lyase/cysteine desulfurase